MIIQQDFGLGRLVPPVVFARSDAAGSSLKLERLCVGRTVANVCNEADWNPKASRAGNRSAFRNGHLHDGLS